MGRTQSLNHMLVTYCDLYENPGRTKVSILHPTGNLDYKNYRELIKVAQVQYSISGTRDMIIDLSDVVRLTCAGVVALHIIACMPDDEGFPDPEFGWQAIHALGVPLDDGILKHFKLVVPSRRLRRILAKARSMQNLEMFETMDEALKSF
jgi:hypothetical protein